MAQNRIKGPQPLLKKGLISAPKIPKHENVVFSFAYFNPDDGQINCKQRDQAYFHTLLARLKVVGTMPVTKFKQLHACRYGPLRAHPINWNHPKSIKTGFGIPQCEEYDDCGWQFSVSVNEHGRVHGFLIDKVFHIVWLDPEHSLYPWD